MLHGDLPLHEDDESLLGDVLREVGSVAAGIAHEPWIKLSEGGMKSLLGAERDFLGGLRHSHSDAQ